MKFPVGNETINCSGPGAQPPLSAATCYKKRKHVNVNHGFNDDKLNQWLGDTDVYVHYLFFPPKEYSYDLPYFIRLTGIDTLATIKLNNQVLAKVKCIFLTVISSNFHMGQFRDDSHQEGAPHFIPKDILISFTLDSWHHK